MLSSIQRLAMEEDRSVFCHAEYPEAYKSISAKEALFAY